MRGLRRAGAAALVVMALVACGGSASAPPAASPPASPSASASGSAASAACAVSTEAATVDVSIADFAFDPATAESTAGGVVGWTNADSAPHSVVLDDGSCSTETLANGQSGALVFNRPGSYPYHCGIHPQMTGTVEVSG